ncbi:hypothetical protein BD779DRAFT_1674412 [Infundibulicybe gibba]|nr:hypothetical protein BD779DRAFT_1674412 [Infundibulicybe gibba]
MYVAELATALASSYPIIPRTRSCVRHSENRHESVGMAESRPVAIALIVTIALIVAIALIIVIATLVHRRLPLAISLDRCHRLGKHASTTDADPAECALASEDIEGASTNTSTLALNTLAIPNSPHILLPPPPSGTPLHTLKQCLHYDPDSKPCLTLHRLFKSLDRGFITLDDLLQKEDWRGVVTLLTGKGKKNEFLRRFDDALEQHTSRDMLPPASASDAADPPIPLPEPSRVSPSRQTLLRGSEEDVDGLVGKAETLLKAEEWEEAVRVLEIAWDRSGRGDRDIYGRLQRAQKLLRQSKQKDYYKVLGVARDADSRTIIRRLVSPPWSCGQERASPSTDNTNPLSRKRPPPH